MTNSSVPRTTEDRDLHPPYPATPPFRPDQAGNDLICGPALAVADARPCGLMVGSAHYFTRPRAGAR